MPKRNKQQDPEPNWELDPRRKISPNVLIPHEKKQTNHNIHMAQSVNDYMLATLCHWPIRLWVSGTGCQGGRCCSECLAVCLLAGAWHPLGIGTTCGSFQQAARLAATLLVFAASPQGHCCFLWKDCTSLYFFSPVWLNKMQNIINFSVLKGYSFLPICSAPNSRNITPRTTTCNTKKKQMYKHETRVVLDTIVTILSALNIGQYRYRYGWHIY